MHLWIKRNLVTGVLRSADSAGRMGSYRHEDEPNAAEEHDGYIGDLCELLDRNAKTHESIVYLLRLEIERMGLADLNGICFATASRKRSLPRG